MVRIHIYPKIQVKGERFKEGEITYVKHPYEFLITIPKNIMRTWANVGHAIEISK